MPRHTELSNKLLKEVLVETSEKMPRPAVTRAYLRDLLELTDPQEWEKQEDALWLRGDGEAIVLHCFRVGIYCAVACQCSPATDVRFNWAALDRRATTLEKKTEDGHLVALEASGLAMGYLAGTNNAFEAVRPILPVDTDYPDLRDREDEASHRDWLEDFVFELRSDLSVNSPSEVFHQPLFSPENISEFASEPRHIVVYFFDGLSCAGEAWQFWSDWYDGFLIGRPLNWELQKRVASIENAIWNAGAEAVAREIARLKVKMALEGLRRLQATSEGARHGVGGNYPPEAIEEANDLAFSSSLVWSAVGDIEEEIAKQAPNKGRVQAILRALEAGLAGILKWCGRKADLAVDTTIKWSVPVVGGAYIAAHPDKIQALIKAIEEWLRFLS